MVLANINRFQAFLIHLAISLGIFIVLLLMIVLVWYPQPFFATDGGWQGIRLVAGVDIVLGPLLTLIVFKQGKPSLKTDLMVIAIIQASALCAGVWIVHQERPVAVVFADDRMIPIPAYQFEEAGMAVADLDRFGDDRPVSIMVELPADIEEYTKVLRNAVQTNRPLYLFGERYVPLDISRLQQLKKASVDLDEYIKGRPEAERKVYEEFLLEHPDAQNRFLFLPLHSRMKTFITVLSLKDLSIVTSLAIVPPTDYFAQGGTIKFKLPKPGQAPDTGVRPLDAVGEAAGTEMDEPVRSGPAAD